MKIGEWFAFAAGCVAGIGFCWMRDKFMVLEYKVGELENPSRTRTNAEGQEGDPEIEDVKGSIGFWGPNGRT